MPWGCECRAKLIKQVPLKPTERREGSRDVEPPGPSHYDQPQIFCGKGYSKVKRAPAYTFGLAFPAEIKKQALHPKAPQINIQGLSRKGRHKITHGVVTPHIAPPTWYSPAPGPGAHEPRLESRLKRAPAYTIQPPARPPYQAEDMWTPSPNMYCPPIPAKSSPAFSFGFGVRETKPQQIPDPGAHDPKFDFVRRSEPAFSLGAAIKAPKSTCDTPAPNTYCEKKFMYTKQSIPAPSFGIRHTPHLGKQAEYLRSSKLGLITDS